jgi:CheY-like chemotaxis protein
VLSRSFPCLVFSGCAGLGGQLGVEFFFICFNVMNTKFFASDFKEGPVQDFSNFGICQGQFQFVVFLFQFFDLVLFVWHFYPHLPGKKVFPAIFLEPSPDGQGAFDMIFVDLNMPLMNGYEAIKVLKEYDNTKKSTIIVITSDAIEDIARKRLPNDAVLMNKPLNLDVIKQFMQYEYALKKR